MESVIFEVKDAVFTYKSSDRTIIDNISFSVKDGDILAVLGPNGAGKTTLLRCILGMVKLQGGECSIDGKNVRKMNPRDLWKQIAYVPQAKKNVSPYSVEETVLLGRSVYSSLFEGPKKSDYESADEIIKLLNLEKIRYKNCNEISGGELQLVLIARAMVARPKLLVLDEPESNLDFRNQLLVLDTISSLAQKGIACIFNTHYPAHALRRANKSLLMDKSGKFIFGETEEILNEENMRKFFGVNAVIGNVKTADGLYRDVIAVSADDNQEKM